MPHRAAVEELRARDVGAIVIGASAGGIEALRTILPGISSSIGVPVMVVLHIGADAKCSWPAVFANCDVPVREAEDKEMAKPGMVFVAPPDYHLLVDDAGALQLSVEEQVNNSRPAIDVLFESAAWSYRDRVLGIVLTGANADGAAGLAAIHRAGGLTWVQSLDEAAHRVMPRAALEAVPSARELSLRAMADAFRAWGADPS